MNCRTKQYKDNLIDAVISLERIVGTQGRLLKSSQQLIENPGDVQLYKLLECLNEALGSYKFDEEVRRLISRVYETLIPYLGITRITTACHSIKTDESDEDLESLTSRLDALIGLDSVKNTVRNLISYNKVQQMRKDYGYKVPDKTMHLAFLGNPGTGKTTVARIVGRIYKQLGLLSNGHFIEVSRTDLIAGYQGQTAHKVKDVISKAKGGVLFIDEAYSLTENDHSDSYGKECLTELTKALEDYRSDLVVIVAGYSDLMKQFFQANPGLESRFNTFIEFEDYQPDELVSIFKQLCSADDYEPSVSLLEAVKKHIEQILDAKSDKFANGRFVRNIYEDCVMNHARRVSSLNKLNPNSLIKLQEEDFKPTHTVFTAK